jgi:hypothetical protein
MNYCFISHRFKYPVDMDNFQRKQVFVYFNIFYSDFLQRSDIANYFRPFANERCTVQETFVRLRTGAALCRRLSSACERAPHSAGDFRPFANGRCTVQETFVRLRTNAALYKYRIINFKYIVL